MSTTFTPLGPLLSPLDWMNHTSPSHSIGRRFLMIRRAGKTGLTGNPKAVLCQWTNVTLGLFKLSDSETSFSMRSIVEVPVLFSNYQ